MTVYVDDMYRYQMGRYGRMKMSHMIADTEDELHTMASKIGIAHRWYQGDHYDVSMSKRALAIKHGAVEVTMRQLVPMMRGRRESGQTSQPGESHQGECPARGQRTEKECVR